MRLRIRTEVLPLLLTVSLLLTPGSAPAAEDIEAAYQRAVTLQRQGDLEGAVAAYREILELEADNPAARSNLGAALAALGRYEQAIEAYRRALELVPGNAGIQYNLALAYYKSGEITNAAEQLVALRETRPDDPRAILLLADCRFRLGELDEVEALLRPLEATKPDNRAVTYLLAMALVRGGKVEEGRRLVDRLVQEGSSAEGHYLLGSVAFMSDDPLEALQELSRALELNPGLPGLRSSYGRALLFTGDVTGAESVLREAVESDPNDYEAHFYLASILAQRGRRDEARPYLDRALQLRPQSTEAQAFLALLDSGGSFPRPSAVSPLDGQPAPDVELRRGDGSALLLSSLRGRPVLLAVGSFTCPWFRHAAPILNRLHERYGDRVTFLMAYIREAHPEDEAYPNTANVREGVSLSVARDEAERSEHAALCQSRLDIPYEVTLDGMDGKVEEAFQAFPSRAFVIDPSGTVAYSTALDEQRFQPDALEAALEAALR